jgi:hypothetical protein
MATTEDSDELSRLSTFRVLPPAMVNSMRDRYYAGVTAAEVRFPFNAAEEDAMTGALAQALIEPETMLVQTPQGVFGWKTTSYKLRGRGVALKNRGSVMTEFFSWSYSRQPASSSSGRGCCFNPKSIGRELTGDCSVRQGYCSTNQTLLS